MKDFFELDEVDRFTVGTVGEPGRRLFLIQIEGQGQSRTLKTEKQIVAAWCDYFSGLLEDVPHFAHLPEDLEIKGPFDIAWETGAMTAEWDMSIDRFRLEIQSVERILDDPLEADNDSLAKVTVTKEQLGAWAIQGRSLVEAGRPPCPLCGYPLDPAGHACPRSNGNRPPQA